MHIIEPDHTGGYTQHVSCDIKWTICVDMYSQSSVFEVHKFCDTSSLTVKPHNTEFNRETTDGKDPGLACKELDCFKKNNKTIVNECNVMTTGVQLICDGG